MTFTEMGKTSEILNSISCQGSDYYGFREKITQRIVGLIFLKHSLPDNNNSLAADQISASGLTPNIC